MQRYLVTGGCGFIGSHLCDALRARGHAVRVLDNLSTGKRENLPPDTELLIGDIADPAVMAQAVRGIDGCFHLAAIASVELGVRDWLGTHRANLTGAITVFDAIRALPGGRRVPVVYASSAAVYGDASPPVAETASCQPLSAYGADKLGCELHARVAGHIHAIPTTGLRFFNVYGPRQDPASPYSGVISIFCERILRGAPITIFGDGLQTRDFVHVSDVVAGLQAAMARQAGRTTTTAEIFNICTGSPISVLDVAETIARLSGTVARIDRKPPRSGEIRHSRGAPELARAVLGFSASTNFSDGLASVLGWMRADGPA
jgi:UDP-glucose 4-epimerase